MHRRPTGSTTVCRSLWLWGLLGLLCAAPGPVLAQELKVLLVTSDRSAPYRDYTATLRQQLPPATTLTVRDASGNTDDLAGYDLVVTVGVKAGFWGSVGNDRPLLAVMLPSNRYDELLAKRGKQGPVSAIYVDQPLGRQVRILGMVLPSNKRVGLLHTSGFEVDHAAWRSVLAAHGMQLVDEQADPARLSASLKRVLADSDVLLAVPDRAIYNGSNIRNILLTSYRRNVPLIGLSQAYVNAGALYAVFSTPEQLAAQTATTLRRFQATRQLPPPQFPQQFSVAVNHEVARMLGIFIKPVEQIEKQAVQQEGKQ